MTTKRPVQVPAEVVADSNQTTATRPNQHSDEIAARPVSIRSAAALPSVADSGRIRFGAGFQLKPAK
jgi:hypothetical protein